MTKLRSSMRRLETPQLNIEDTPILAPDGSLRGGAQRLLTFAQISCDRDSGRERGGPFSGLRKHDVAFRRFASHAETLIGCDGEGLDRDWLEILWLQTGADATRALNFLLDTLVDCVPREPSETRSERKTNLKKSLLEGDHEVWPCVSAAGERDGNFSENSSSVSWLDLGDAVVDDVQECFADEAGAGFSWLRIGNKLSGDVRGLSGGTPEACLTDRHEVSSCGPCAPRAQKSWVSLAVQCQAAQLPTTSRRCMPVPLDGPGRKRSGSKDVVLERDEYEDHLDFVTMRRLKATSGRGSTQRRWLTGTRSRRRR